MAGEPERPPHPTLSHHRNGGEEKTRRPTSPSPSTSWQGNRKDPLTLPSPTIGMGARRRRGAGPPLTPPLRKGGQELRPSVCTIDWFRGVCGRGWFGIFGRGRVGFLGIGRRILFVRRGIPGRRRRLGCCLWRGRSGRLSRVRFGRVRR